MEIRPAQTEDISDIVSLLKISLGESLTPKSETYWRWKHVNNPFGPSPVLLAFEKEHLVGVRAFMRWKWEMDGHSFNAVRAVDTATHPDFQGRGIFKTLTLALLENCKKEGVRFVFNTPNQQSRPGYLKMGWRDAGRMSVQVRPLNPLEKLLPLQKDGRKDDIISILESPGLSDLLKADAMFSKKLRTSVTVDYLRWRYLEVPIVKYIAIHDKEEAAETLLFARLKKSRIGTEFRITDLFCSQQQVPAGFTKLVKRAARFSRADYITCSGAIRGRFSLGVQRRGPITTFRLLDWDGSHMLENFGNWAPSLGDLELF